MPAALGRKIKWIGVLLACFMLAMFCAYASAEEVTIVASGYCGRQYVNGIDGGNMTYRLNSNGKLTISGWGEMRASPFSSYSADILSVEVESGVTSVGDYAFDGCSSLISISIPDSVTVVGRYAFTGCGRLTSINIPDGVSEIGYGAFSGCSGLKSISLPDSVTVIGGRAFSGCSSLTSVHVSEGLTKIGDQAFYGCSTLANFNMPTSVTEIGNWAFGECKNLTSLNIPEGVTEIGDFVLWGCRSLTSLIIPQSATTIGSSAFSSCFALKHVIVPDHFRVRLDKTSSPIIYCHKDSIADIWATEKGYQVVYLDDLDLTQPLDMTLTVPQTALLSNETVTLTPVVFPAQTNQPIQWRSSAPNVISVENGVLTVLVDGAATITATCGGLSDSVDLWGSATLDSFRTNVGGKLTTIAPNTFGGSRFENILLPESCTAIASKAFENNTNLKAVYIPTSVTVIASDAFEGCGDFVIIGEEDSKAEEYAQKNHLAFYTRLSR